MPASHPSLNIANNQASATPTLIPSGNIIMDPLSGPKGSPLDVRVITGYVNGAPTYAAAPTTQTPSTGAMSTGIGFGSDVLINPLPSAPRAIFAAGFNDNATPGRDARVVSGGSYAAPPPNGVVVTDVDNSNMLYIGGGRSQIVLGNGAGGNGATPATKVSVPQPYTAGVPILGYGNGGSRDAGAGPIFTGFATKMVTAAAGVAVGGVVEAGFANRAQRALVAGESVFGSATAASAVPA